MDERTGGSEKRKGGAEEKITRNAPLSLAGPHRQGARGTMAGREGKEKRRKKKGGAKKRTGQPTGTWALAELLRVNGVVSI